MYFSDLGTKTQIDDGGHVRAIGWLSADQSFAVGDVSGAFVSRLRLLCSQWEAGAPQLCWAVAAGRHTCEICGQFRSTGNIGVPAGQLLFVAPEMVLHYVEAHRYQPPEEFVAAVIACHVPGTEDYGNATAAFRQINERRFRATGRDF